jgi:hypothetical protein
MTDFCVGAPMLRRILRQADLMDDMMHCVGVAPACAARLDKCMAWYEARSRCIACPHDRLCRQWVAQHGPAALEPPRYCPNGEFFRSWATRRNPLTKDCDGPPVVRPLR